MWWKYTQHTSLHHTAELVKPEKCCLSTCFNLVVWVREVDDEENSFNTENSSLVRLVFMKRENRVLNVSAIGIGLSQPVSSAQPNKIIRTCLHICILLRARRRKETVLSQFIYHFVNANDLNTIRLPFFFSFALICFSLLWFAIQSSKRCVQAVYSTPRDIQVCVC